MVKRRTMKGAKKRQCSVCLHRVFYAHASPFPLRNVANGRAPGSVRLEVPAGELLCSVCIEANPGLAAKVNPLPVAYATKGCHRCGGCGRVATDDKVGRWMSAPAETMPCPKCGGAGEVAA